MKVKYAAVIGCCGLFIALCAAATPAFADNGAAVDDRADVIGIVPLTKAGVTRNVYRYVDRIVPKLKKLPSERIIKLECSYNGLSERERDVMKAYQIAGHVGKYLRERHKLNHELWIAANIGRHTSQHAPALTFSVLSDDIKNLETVPVVPVASAAE